MDDLPNSSQLNAPLPVEASSINDQPQAAALAEAAPQPLADTTLVYNPEGVLVHVPTSQLEAAFDQGFHTAPADALEKQRLQQQYGGAGQQAIAGVEGIAKGLVGPAAPLAERAMGITPEAIEGRAAANPWTHGIGEAAGFIAPAVLTGGATALGKAGLTGAAEAVPLLAKVAGFTQAGLLEKVGAAGVEKLGLGAVEGVTQSAMAKIGSMAAKGAIENAVFQGGDEASKFILQDPAQSTQTALVDIGLSALLGGAVSGALGTVPPMWQAATGNKVGGLLGALTDKLGGREGSAIPDVMQSALDKIGVTMSPEVRAGLMSEPAVREMFTILNQSDTTSSGKALQGKVKEFSGQAQEFLANTLGKRLAEVSPELSQYEAGKAIGKQLAAEYADQMSPLAKEFDSLRASHHKIELGTALDRDAVTKAQELGAKANEAAAAGDIGLASDLQSQAKDAVAHVADTAVPTTAKIASDVVAASEHNGWTTSPSSDIMAGVNRILKELPGLKTLGDLTHYISEVGNNMQSNPLNGPLNRAGAILKGILKDAEGSVLEREVGKTGGEEAIARLKEVRSAYAAQSRLKEAVDARLHAKGSTSGYAKSLLEMANTDGEALVRRISGKNDADMLNVLQENFPKTAELVKQHHVNEALAKAAKMATGGDALSPKALLTAIEGMTPEVRNFALKPEQIDKVRAMGDIITQLQDTHHNFSNSGRVVDKLLQYVPASVIAAAAALAGHNPAAAILVGSLTKVLSKDAPDAVKLSLLKFLGSPKEINAAGLKASVDFIHASMRGETMISRAAKNVFVAGRDILPEHLIPSDKDRKSLDKKLQSFQGNPSEAMEIGGHTSHYMPEHGQELAQVATSVSQYLNSQRPSSDNRKSPFDTKMPPNAAQQAAYNRLLDIAEQPLVVIKSISDGTLTVKDVIGLKTMYPAAYARLSSKLTSEMMEHANKDRPLPYATRLGLSTFLGQPLDSTMTAQSIQAAQPTPAQAQQQAQQKGGMPEATANGMNKMAKGAMTPGQAAESARSSRK